MLKRCFILAVIVFTILGCVKIPFNVNINSKRDAAYRDKIDKLLIFVSLNEAKLDSLSVGKSFIAKLSTRGVVTESLVIKPADSKDMQKNAQRRFKPKQIMYLFPTSISTTGYSGRYSGSTDFSGWILECSIVETKMGKRIWRASINHISGMAYGQENADILVDKIIEQLDVDGLLPDLNTVLPVVNQR